MCVGGKVTEWALWLIKRKKVVQEAIEEKFKKILWIDQEAIQ